MGIGILQSDCDSEPLWLQRRQTLAIDGKLEINHCTCRDMPPPEQQQHLFVQRTSHLPWFARQRALGGQSLRNDPAAATNCGLSLSLSVTYPTWESTSRARLLRHARSF